MAEVVLGGVVESVTGHLVSLISQEIRLACGVRAELEKLQTTVSVIGGMLREADKRRVEAEDVKEWLKKLKELFYDADDLLDDFSTEVLRRRRVMVGGKRILNEVSIFFSFSNQLFYAIKMAHRVKEIRGRIDAIWNDRHACFHLEGNSNLMGSLEENQTRSETYSFEPEMYVVGRDKEKKEVMEFLLNPDFEESVSIVPIVGVGGQGKTTLARKVFNDDKVKEYFEMRLIWVCVSTSFSVKDILRKIVRECSPNKEGIANLDMNELRKKLGEWINGKKYLLVLDDVWNDNRSKWLELQGFLMSGAKGSKILVTTRSTRVAETMTRKFYKLSGLPSDESLSLLMQMAMKEEHEWKNQNLEKIAREIVKKCAGIPLAIKTIGRLLVFSGSTEEDWLNFKDNDLSLINQEEDDIMPTLKLSYDFLPSHLKPCFAYCSLFPQDYELEPRELVYLWMAHGFINKSLGSKKTLEEVGYDYFRELLSRSFFQDMQVDLYGDIMSCRMHDLMHDLARFVAGESCITIDSSHAKMFPEGARHVTTNDQNVLNGFERDRRMRSLFLMVEGSIDIAVLDVSCFRSLRALRICGGHIKVISRSIAKLKHLRSLDLSKNDGFRYLPNSISKLCNLESLNLTGCRDLKELPSGITKLVNLRQLRVRGCYNLRDMPRGIGKLTNLQMLDVFVVGEKLNRNAAELNELSKLTGLREKLTIQSLERVESSSISSEVNASFSMEKLADLQCLRLCWRYFRDVSASNGEEVLEKLRPHRYLKGLRIEGYGGARLPSWVSQLHRLVDIEIKQCQGCRQLPPVDQLPSLKRIFLVALRDLEHIELSKGGTMSQSNFFPSLEEIKLYRLPKFKGWD
ncbi:putative disease resistance protein RGA4 [Punica granatum]|uniref:Disease resistance protein RGA4 n=1 Tax=Punica granatum TaxID=22663 RepID=A0A6P8ERP7_PUNGR|nr:putative disease resistance protein RGA4 [Punica granatum]